MVEQTLARPASAPDHQAFTLHRGDMLAEEPLDRLDRKRGFTVLTNRGVQRAGRAAARVAEVLSQARHERPGRATDVAAAGAADRVDRVPTFAGSDRGCCHRA